MCSIKNINTKIKTISIIMRENIIEGKNLSQLSYLLYIYFYYFNCMIYFDKYT